MNQVNWGEVLTNLLIYVTPFLVTLLFTLLKLIQAVTKFLDKKANRELAANIIMFADSIVEKYKSQVEGEYNVADIVDIALDEMVEQLKSAGVSSEKAETIAKRELARAAVRSAPTLLAERGYYKPAKKTSSKKAGR